MYEQINVFYKIQFLIHIVLYKVQYKIISFLNLISMPLSFLKRNFINPVLEWLYDSRAIGIILLSCTCISLLLSNISTENWYTHLWHIEFKMLAAWHLPYSIHMWINDGLMTLFFFLAGMEIKREIKIGELSSIKKAILPIGAAVGGMIVPAVLFLLFNKGTIFAGGWGIPMATDIAFSLGIASLLGKKVPISAKIFLTALAIIDDLGAMLVIALFYGGAIQLTYLLLAAAIVFLIIMINKTIRFGWLQCLLGLALWFCMYNSGIHATLAGIVFAFLIPTKQLTDYEHKVHPVVNFIILPLFAFANTAIVFPQQGLQTLSNTLSWGIIIGLFIGKPLGIISACWVLVKNKIAVLPYKTNWSTLIGAGILAGIGFTMSIFISTLAFAATTTQDIAKIAVLIASILAMVIGYAWIMLTNKKT